MLRSIATILVAFCAVISGYSQTREVRKVDSFDGIKASSGINVYLKKGSKESVEIEVQGIDADRVVTEVSGGTLRIGLESGNYRGSVRVKVYVTFVTLEELSVSSAAGIYSESVIEATDLELSASSAGNIEVQIKAVHVDISTSSSGDIEVTGKAEVAELQASSAGDIDAYDLEVKKAKARASSAGSIKINVIDDIDASASSGGSIRYRGNPGRSHTSSSSGGSIHKTME